MDFASHAHTVLRTLMAVAALFAVLAGEAYAKDKVVQVPNEDREMQAAIAKARSSLPMFWEVYERKPRGESDFNLKVRISDGRGAEHFWLSDIERKDGKLYGVISNDPNNVHTVVKGQRIEIPEPDISDWLYYRNGKMVGNYTMRAMFKYMPPDQVEYLKRQLADP